MQNDAVFSVSDFVAVLNQTLEFAYPSVIVVGELANLRVSKGRWVYFDLQDEQSSVKFFGTVYQLPGPLEDGMMLQVRGVPRLHPRFGFSVNVQFMQPVGEGSLKKAADLLAAKLEAEGLFDPSRKRALPYPPRKVGLITSKESAAYKDFVKILNERWGGVEVVLADVQVQGEPAVGQVVRAIDYFDSHGNDIDALVITRGGGSADDLAVFSTEQVTRAVAGSRIPTLVAIGHEVDVSLAELAADQRASTPSNAAQMLVPDKDDALRQLSTVPNQMNDYILRFFAEVRAGVVDARDTMTHLADGIVRNARQSVASSARIIEAYDPQAALRRGYALVRTQQGALVRSIRNVSPGDSLALTVHDGTFYAAVVEKSSK